MLYLALLTMTLATSQTLKIEVSDTVEEYLSQLGLTPNEYIIVVSDQMSRGAAVLYERDASDHDFVTFFFNLKLLQKLSRGERRVLISHEVGHLAPECQRLWERIYRELCADEVSLKLVPVEDVSAMLSKSIRMFPYYPARQEFVLRLALIQEMRPVNREGEPTVARSSGASARDDWMDCA
ncbi:MAG: hypothetical protein IH937_15265 [Acidobacteria bacterium]|nr:hypothetical protein [Acidobacteriota bacterium]